MLHSLWLQFTGNKNCSEANVWNDHTVVGLIRYLCLSGSVHFPLLSLFGYTHRCVHPWQWVCNQMTAKNADQVPAWSCVASQNWRLEGSTLILKKCLLTLKYWFDCICLSVRHFPLLHSSETTLLFFHSRILSCNFHVHFHCFDHHNHHLSLSRLFWTF